MTQEKNDGIYILFMGIMMSFLGWVMECISGLLSTGYIDSQGYFLPLIPSYSLVIFTWYLIIKRFPKLVDYKGEEFSKIISYNVILYLALCLAVFLIEIVYGNLMEILFNVKLWSYRKIPMHVTQYASVPTALGIGMGAFLLIRFVFPSVLNFLRKHVDAQKLKIINIVIWSLIIIDLIVYHVYIAINSEVPIRWKIELQQYYLIFLSKLM